MAWQVMEYMDNNPQSTPLETLAYFAESLEIDQTMKDVKNEVNNVLVVRDHLRPLYGKKMNIEVSLTLIDSDFDSDVMVKYPPRQGTDKDRKAYRKELQDNHEQYKALSEELKNIKEQIEVLELNMKDVQQEAKNGRRILETFNMYAQYIFGNVRSTAAMHETSESSNANVF